MHELLTLRNYWLLHFLGAVHLFHQKLRDLHINLMELLQVGIYKTNKKKFLLDLGHSDKQTLTATDKLIPREAKSSDSTSFQHSPI